MRAINSTKCFDKEWTVSYLFFFAVDANARRAAAMDDKVIAMCNHDMNVLSEAKKVFGSRRCGMVVLGPSDL